MSGLPLSSLVALRNTEMGIEMSAQGKNEVDPVMQQWRAIADASSLVELDKLLTQSMAQLQIQALLKDEGLSKVLARVEELSQAEDDEAASLQALAVLGRLAAVARGREGAVNRTVVALSPDHDLPSLEGLDSDGKAYAAQCLLQLDTYWLNDYALRESVVLDTAEKPRKLLIELLLKRFASVAEAWAAHIEALEQLEEISNPESRLRRARRISGAWLEVLRSGSFEPGGQSGTALSEWVAALLQGDNKDVDEGLLFSIVDDAFDLLLRLIELRFSHAMLSDTYQVIGRARSLLGRARWIQFLIHSRSREAVNLCLRESALVLARQGKTDKALMDVMQSLYLSKAQMMKDLTRHFEKAQELDPDVRQWWVNAGVVTGSSRAVVHKVGISEDQMIGELLIEVLNTQPFMEALRDSVAPLLEINDPISAEKVTGAAAGYADIARNALMLARMRRLSKTALKGEIVEFNPLQHELLSDVRQGVRSVKVVRDGIQKDFGGSIKMLIKPRVEPHN